jgi:hypothetical protein
VKRKGGELDESEVHCCKAWLDVKQTAEGFRVSLFWIPLIDRKGGDNGDTKLKKVFHFFYN